jgi:hypothetical protein
MGTPGPAIDLNHLFTDPPGGQTNNDSTSKNSGYRIANIDLSTAQEDSEKEMWTTYLEEVKEPDRRITDTWKEDANALVVFVRPNPLISPFLVMTASKTGLFSAIVAAFIIESYKKLSPDSGDETVVLLRQISQQLANSTNGTFPPATGIKPSPPSTHLICVNAMWLMSLVFSISSALFATLLQQWARRYIQKPQIPRELNQRARVRSFLYDGTEKFKMRPVVEIAPTLLHVSVFLFFVGLGIFFVPINKTVGIVVSVAIGLFGVAYLTITILPCIKHNCPYRTPMTVFCWYLWHSSFLVADRFLRWAVERLHDGLVQDNSGSEMSTTQQLLVNWLESREGAFEKHWDSLRDGLEKSTIKGAQNAPADEDRKILTWLLNRLALVDKSKLRKFVASIPRNTITQLMTPPIDSESGRITLRDSLLTLLRSGAIGTRAVGLDEDVRRRSLLVCLDAVRHVAEALVSLNADPDVLHDIRINFANISLMRAMWADGDAAIRLTSRSICALLARCLVHRGQLEGPELAWLQDVTGEPSNTIYNSSVSNLGHINLKSFVYGVLPLQQGDLPAEHVASFTKTLAILMDAGAQVPFNKTVFRTGLGDLIQRIEGDGDHGNAAANTLRQMYESIL